MNQRWRTPHHCRPTRWRWACRSGQRDSKIMQWMDIIKNIFSCCCHSETASSGGESKAQSQTSWRNKHLKPHQFLLWSLANYWREEISEITFYIFGIKTRINLQSHLSIWLQQQSVELTSFFRCSCTAMLNAHWSWRVNETTLMPNREERGKEDKNAEFIESPVASMCGTAYGQCAVK